MTFDEIITDANSTIKDVSTAGTVVIKKGIVAALTKMRNKMRRNYTNVTRTIYFKQGQSVYQLPENAIRFGSLKYKSGGERTPVNYLDSEHDWDMAVSQGSSGGRPSLVRMIDNDTFEVYPAPGEDTQGEIKYQARAKRPTFSPDYTTGTVAVVNGSQTVNGTGTTWDATMVQKSIKLETSIEDSTDYYRIIAVTSATQLTIENYYDGPNETGKTYRIGEVPNLPEEMHPALSDYGLYYFYLWRKDKDMAQEFNANFIQTLNEIDGQYDGPTVSKVIQSRKVTGTGRSGSNLMTTAKQRIERQ